MIKDRDGILLYLGEDPWRDIECPYCKENFMALRWEGDHCPNCRTEFRWVSKPNFYEFKCMKCKKYIDVEFKVDGSCLCGQKYKWVETKSNIFEDNTVLFAWIENKNAN